MHVSWKMWPEQDGSCSAADTSLLHPNHHSAPVGAIVSGDNSNFSWASTTDNSVVGEFQMWQPGQQHDAALSACTTKTTEKLLLLPPPAAAPVCVMPPPDAGVLQQQQGSCQLTLTLKLSEVHLFVPHLCLLPPGAAWIQSVPGGMLQLVVQGSLEDVVTGLSRVMLLVDK